RIEALSQRAVTRESRQLLVEAVVPVNEEPNRAGDADALGIVPVRGELELIAVQRIAAQNRLRKVAVAVLRLLSPENGFLAYFGDGGHGREAITDPRRRFSEFLTNRG